MAVNSDPTFAQIIAHLRRYSWQVAAGFAVLLAGAYELGRLQAEHTSQGFQSAAQTLGTQLRGLTLDNAALTRKVSELETDAKVNAESYRQIDQQLAELQAKIIEQQESLAFFQGAFADPGQSHLRIEGVDIHHGSDQRSFTVHVILAGAARAERLMSGYLTLEVQGTAGGKRLNLGLDELEHALSKPGRVPFSFRYFQDVRTDVNLPQGFSAERLIVRLMPAASAAKGLERTYPWTVRSG